MVVLLELLRLARPMRLTAVLATSGPHLTFLFKRDYPTALRGAQHQPCVKLARQRNRWQGRTAEAAHATDCGRLKVHPKWRLELSALASPAAEAGQSHKPPIAR